MDALSLSSCTSAGYSSCGDQSKDTYSSCSNSHISETDLESNWTGFFRESDTDLDSSEENISKLENVSPNNIISQTNEENDSSVCIETNDGIGENIGGYCCDDIYDSHTYETGFIRESDPEIDSLQEKISKVYIITYCNIVLKHDLITKFFYSLRLSHLTKILHNMMEVTIQLLTVRLMTLLVKILIPLICKVLMVLSWKMDM